MVIMKELTNRSILHVTHHQVQGNRLRPELEIMGSEVVSVTCRYIASHPWRTAYNHDSLGMVPHTKSSTWEVEIGGPGVSQKVQSQPKVHKILQINKQQTDHWLTALCCPIHWLDNSGNLTLVISGQFYWRVSWAGRDTMASFTSDNQCHCQLEILGFPL